MERSSALCGTGAVDNQPDKVCCSDDGSSLVTVAVKREHPSKPVCVATGDIFYYHLVCDFSQMSLFRGQEPLARQRTERC